ncbi:MAG: arginine deiminase-related protein [Pseudomonadota bacterium]
MPEAQQSTDTVVMIRPFAFGFNADTAASNRYQAQQPPEHDVSEVARREFDALASTLSAAGVNVVTVDDTADPHTPDALFPNNWFSTHADGQVVLYPMLAPSRRAERRRDIFEQLQTDRGHSVSDITDFSGLEANDVFVEGTGSLVLDRHAKVAYACLSDRTDPVGVKTICQALGYTPVMFTGVDAGGIPIYHTNVCLAIGTNWAIVSAEALASSVERAAVLDALAESGREIVTISLNQVAKFCGNALELMSTSGETLIAMSSQAHGALDELQRLTLSRHGRIVHADIGTIERLAGGSVRCMLAEIFLPAAR